MTEPIVYNLSTTNAKSLLKISQIGKCEVDGFSLEGICVNEPEWSELYCAACFYDKTKHRCSNPQLQNVDKFLKASNDQF